MYGIGELNTQGTLPTRSMGGVGVAMRNSGVMNLLNPASYSVTPQKSVLFDFGVEGQNYYNAQTAEGATKRTAYNTFNFHDIAFQLPLAKKLGISHLLSKYPYEVSGGEQQRAAVARALITNPRLILADEPTGALDSRATESLLNLFGEINAEGQTILMVTHSVKAAAHAGRVLFLRDGEVYHQLYRGQQTVEQMFGKISDTLTVMTQGGELDA